MVKVLPKSVLGKFSVGFILLAPLLFQIGNSFVTMLYDSVPSGDTIFQDLQGRPLLVIAMLLGNLSAILSFLFGILGVIKKRERALLVYISTVLGGLFTIFIIMQLADI